MSTTTPYRVGSILAYQPFGGPVRRVRVDAAYSDIKNGRPGFDGELIDAPRPSDDPDANCVWGYDDQILRVERF
jgi:hypothetical protein